MSLNVLRGKNRNQRPVVGVRQSDKRNREKEKKGRATQKETYGDKGRETETM